MNYKKITKNDLYPALKLDTKKHLLRSKILASRNEQLKYIKKKSICMEIGVFKGDFSQQILDICKPSKLYLIEINTEYCNELNIKFKKEIDNNIVEIINENSINALNKFGVESIDYIYIDADHTYEGVKNDLNKSHKILKKKGYIGLNDYIYFDYILPLEYGIMQASHEFIIKNNYQVMAFCLEPHGFHDIIIKKI